MANGRQSADQGERVRIAVPSKDEMARTPASGMAAVFSMVDVGYFVL